MPANPVHIHEVDTTKRRDVTRFTMFPFKLYEGDPYWVPVPPLISDTRLLLNRQKNPYYRQNDATFLLAVRDGEDVGRVAVMHPKYYNEFKGLKEAHFYLFDSIDDQGVANALFDAAVDWAKQRGLNTFRGPLGFMAFDGFGMLAKGFELRPAVGIPYNYEYYTRLAETWGFELEERVLSGHVDIPYWIEHFPERILSIAERVKKRYGFDVMTYPSKRALRRNVVKPMVDLYNRTLTHIAGDPPLAEESVQVVVDNIALIAEADLIKFIVKDGEIVGFLFCLLNIADGIRKARSRLFPFGFIHILRDMKKTVWADLNGMGIVPEYHGMGGTALLYAELYYTLRQNPRFQHGDVVQISEFNHQSLNEMKKFGVDFYKTHHIYRKKL